jgi:hypothetical protein
MLYRLDWLKQDFAPELWAKLAPLGREKMAEWADQNSRYLHPSSNQQLETDEDLLALGITFDQPEFFTRTIADLRAGGAAAERARQLLHRYAPSGPDQGGADEWAAWWKVNQPYLFASDAGDYCWYLDCLAKKRGVPTNELRGLKRAGSTSTVTANR